MTASALNLTFANVWYITSTVLFSCGHWIGGTISLLMGSYMAYNRKG